MRQGFLSQYFTGVASKRLTAVDAEQHRSNQHEFSGVSELKAILGDADRQRIPATFLYLSDGNDPVSEQGFVSWYDARRAHPRRSEWRLYYPDTEVSSRAGEGDLLIIATRPDKSVLAIIADDRSTVSRQLAWLFGTGAPELPGFALTTEAETDRIALQFASRLILDELGIDPWTIEQEAHLQTMLARFGGSLPDTRTFSAFARETVPRVDVGADPDAALIGWLEREELLFRAFERHLISDRLKRGFSEVDDFLQFSLSVQNRRKVRAGSALENHLEHIFRTLGIHHDRTPVTEGKARPDFLFPGSGAYRDARFPTEMLTVLGVKTSCKDRWRQVLAEADRIPEKHLLTLEPAITPAQTSEMQQKKVRLVVPGEIQATYTAAQRPWLLAVSDLAALLLERQSRGETVLEAGRLL
jgi:hypothetical protein